MPSRSQPGTAIPTRSWRAPAAPTAFRPPGFPVLLGGVYAVVGVHSRRTRWTSGLVAEAALGAVTVALIGLLALALWGIAPGLIAAAIAAVYPPFLLAGTSLTSETLFLPLTLAALLCVLRYRHSRRLRWAVAAGIAVGLAALTRSNGVVLAIPLAMGVFGPWGLRNRHAAALAAASLAAAALTVVPWTIRNAVVMDHFVPVSTQAGYGLAGAYNDTSRENSDYPAAWRPPLEEPRYAAIIRDPGLGEIQVERRLRSAARRFIGNHPAYVGRVGFYNAVRLLDLRDRGLDRQSAADLGMSTRLERLSRWSFWAVALLALAGLLHPAVRRTPAFVAITPLLLILTTVFIAASTRYRLPADPFLVALAGLGVVQLSRLGQPWRSAQS